jgi:hypothetical protein
VANKEDKISRILPRVKRVTDWIKRQEPVEVNALLGFFQEVSELLISHSFDLNRVLTLVADLTIRIGEGEKGFILLFGEDNKAKVQVNRGQGEVDLGRDQFAYSKSILKQVMESGEGIYIPNMMEEPAFRDAASIVQRNLLSCICVPLKRRETEELLGILYVDSTKPSNNLKPSTLRVINILANIATSSIRHSTLTESFIEYNKVRHALKIAKGIHDFLSPTRDAMASGQPQFDIHGESIPCEHVSGDYFDIVPSEGGKLVIIVGDVVGHGIGPSLLKVSLRGALHAEWRYQRDLQTLLDNLNRDFSRITKPGVFMTLLVTVIDMQENQVTFCSAGHLFPILYRAETGTLAEFDEVFLRPPLGVPSEQPFRVSPPYPLAVGDVLLGYTDGFSEAMTEAKEEFGEARIADVLKRSAGLEASAILQDLKAEVERFVGGKPPADDMTAVVAKRVK